MRTCNDLCEHRAGSRALHQVNPRISAVMHTRSGLSGMLTTCLSHCMSVSLHVCLTACLSHCMSVSLHVCPSHCMSISLHVCLSHCMSVCLTACLSHCMSVSLHVCLTAYLTGQMHETKIYVQEPAFVNVLECVQILIHAQMHAYT
jgi:hypothetical protein